MQGSEPKRGCACWALGLLGLLAGAGAQASQVQGSVGASTDNVFRGVSLSDEQASLFGDLHAAGLTWYGGVAVNTVRPGPGQSTEAQVIPYLAYQQPLGGDLQVTWGLRHYDYLGDPHRNRYDYDEVDGSLTWKGVLSFQLVGSPDTYKAGDYRYGRGAAFAAELSARQPLAYGVDADLGVGYYDLRREVGTGYVYWSAALSKRWNGWTLSALYVGTDEAARRLFGSSAGQRWVATAMWSF